MKKKNLLQISFNIFILFSSYDVFAIEYIAHRGDSGAAPENTLPAYYKAWFEKGALLAECDVQLTSDGQIVLLHDDSPERVTKNKFNQNAADTEYKDLYKLDVGEIFGANWKGVTIPTLQNVIGLKPHGKILVVEIKTGNDNAGADPKLLSALVELLNTIVTDDKEILFISFDHNAVAYMKKHRPQNKGFILTAYTEVDQHQWGYVRNDTELDATIAFAKKYGIDGLDMEFSPKFLSQEKVDKIQASGLQVAVWTYHKLDDRDYAEIMNCAGVDYLTTDYPLENRNHLSHETSCSQIQTKINQVDAKIQMDRKYKELGDKVRKIYKGI